MPHHKNRSPRLQSGYAYETHGHWQESTDDDWDTVMITPTGSERYVGVRMIDGSRMNVFRSDGAYVAQLEHMTRNHKGLLVRNAGEQDYLIRRGHGGAFTLHMYDGWSGKVGRQIGAREGYGYEKDAAEQAGKHAREHDVGDAIVVREHTDGSTTQIGNVGSYGYRAGGMQRNAELPKPRPRVDTSLSRVRRIEREHTLRERPFDPDTRYPRETKRHHFAINPDRTDPRDVPAHLRPVRVGYTSEYKPGPEHNGDHVSYGVFENGEAPDGEPQWYEIEYASGSDYSGGSVTEANNREIEKMLEEHHPADQQPLAWVTAYGGHGTYALFVVYDELDDEIKETLGALEDYPAVSDESVSEVESEREEEAWESWAQRDFEKEFLKQIGSDDDWPEDVDPAILFRIGMSAGNEYWIHESGDSVFIHMDRVVDAVVRIMTGQKAPPGWLSPDDWNAVEDAAKAFQIQRRLPGVR